MACFNLRLACLVIAGFWSSQASAADAAPVSDADRTLQVLVQAQEIPENELAYCFSPRRVARCLEKVCLGSANREAYALTLLWLATRIPSQELAVRFSARVVAQITLLAGEESRLGVLCARTVSRLAHRMSEEALAASFPEAIVSCLASYVYLPDERGMYAARALQWLASRVPAWLLGYCFQATAIGLLGQAATLVVYNSSKPRKVLVTPRSPHGNICGTVLVYLMERNEVDFPWPPACSDVSAAAVLWGLGAAEVGK